MRFHRLSMTAFGPYAGTEVVDFDELNEAGIFLLTGPTGAGKSSILDAICFALYGVVPGERGVRTLRSHHAGAGVAPEVVLELTLGAQRFRVRRSPEWTRPKKRGTGETKENASATLVELTDGVERLVSSRAAEVGLTLGAALGMGSEQFMQVVMLPQGEFATFLRASSDQRQEVLQRLFRTQRFARIEDWMRERTRALGVRAASGERQVTQVLATLADRAGVCLPDDLATAVSGGSLAMVGEQARAWAGAVLESAAAHDATAQQHDRLAQERLAVAEDRQRAAVAVATVQSRRQRALAALARVDDAATETEAHRATVRRHEEAQRVRPLLDAVARTEQRRREAEAVRDRALGALALLERDDPAPMSPDSQPDPQPADYGAAVASLTQRLADLRAVLPHEQALDRVRSHLAAAQRRLGSQEAVLAASRERLSRLPPERDALTARHTAASALAGTVDSERSSVAEGRVRAEAACRLVEAEVSHARLVESTAQARDHAADLREAHLALLERRLAGMAGELAGQLEDDRPCLVCGSCAHPRPATAGRDAVTDVEQRTAARAAHEARSEHERLVSATQESAGELERCRSAAAGRTPEAAEAELAQARRRLVAAESAAVDAAALSTRLALLVAAEREQTAAVQAAEGRRGALTAEIEAATTRAEELTSEVTAAVGACGGSLADALARCSARRAALVEVVEAESALRHAEESWTDAQSHAEMAAWSAGFASAAEATAALLADPMLARLRDELTRHEQERVAAQAVLAEPEVADLADTDAPDLARCAQDAAQARDEARRGAAEAATAAGRLVALRSLLDQLEAALEEWEPARRKHETADDMARLVRGMGRDNQLQMRLSSYVLATRLDQVLEAANERLSQMRDQRYSLHRTARGRGGARAGLGLEVLDAWTGEVRSPTSLSGGETFVVSLALALGLADVVAEESGGLRVDTLFVDEGFGMLDPDTLDDVMDRIDELRAGGRTVGVVSHVTELRARIPTQVHVTLGRTGSSVAVRTLVP